MGVKNNEAQQCVNTNRASMSETAYKETNMNIVTKNELTFQEFTFNPVMENGVIWLTSTELAKVLGYKKTDAISQIYSRNSDEFTNSMTMTLNMSVNGINNSLRNKVVRVYSLRGCHLIAMFATTKVAKDFRKWVLDILDREVEHSPIAKQFTDEELCTLAYLWRSSAVMYEACKEIHPLLAVAEHRLLSRFTSIGTNYARGINKAREILHRETRHIEEQPWGDSNWKNVFSYGRNTLQ